MIIVVVVVVVVVVIIGSVIVIVIVSILSVLMIILMIVFILTDNILTMPATRNTDGFGAGFLFSPSTALRVCLGLLLITSNRGRTKCDPQRRPHDAYTNRCVHTCMHVCIYLYMLQKDTHINMRSSTKLCL